MNIPYSVVVSIFIGHMNEAFTDDVDTTVDPLPFTENDDASVISNYNFIYDSSNDFLNILFFISKWRQEKSKVCIPKTCLMRFALKYFKNSRMTYVGREERYLLNILYIFNDKIVEVYIFDLYQFLQMEMIMTIPSVLISLTHKLLI